MAIAPLQLPSSAAFTPTIDFSPLGDLGKVYREAQNRRTLADLGAGLADGSVNYQQAAGKLASTGNLTGVVSLLQLGEAQRKRDAELAAGRQADSLFSSLYGGGGASTGAPVAASGDPRGIRNNNPLNLEASPFTQRQPGFTGSDGRFGQFGSMDQGFAAADNLLQSYAQRGINTVGGIVGRWAPANDGNPVSAYAQFVARKVGVDPNAPIDMSDPGVRQRVLGAMAEFENGRPVQVASAGGGALPANAQPAQGVLPQAAPQGEEPLSSRMMGLLRARNIPNLPAAYRESIDKAIDIERDRSKRPDAIRKYQFAVKQGYRGSFMDFEKELKRAGAIDEPKVVELFDEQTGQPYKATYDPETKSFKRVGGVKAPSGMQITTNPDGTVSITQGAVGGGGKLTEQQSKDMVFVTRANGSLPIIDKMGDNLASLTQYSGSQMPLVGNYLVTKEYQQAKQAGLEFLQAILRKDTGAAITPQETTEYGKVYLPQPGDSAEVLSQKKASRQRAVQAIQLGLPPHSILALEKAGVKLVGQPNGGQQGQPQRVNDKAAFDALPSGTRFVAPDGSVRIKP